MFDRELIPMRVSRIEHRTMTKDEQEINLVEVLLEVSPFTVELASDLDDFVRRTLFTVKDAEVSNLLKGATFQLPIKPQMIAVRMAPDQGAASYTIDEAKVGVLHARRSKKSSAWRLLFTVTFAPMSEHQLAQVVEDFTKTRYLTFANAAAGLFDVEEKEVRRGKRGKPNGAVATEVVAAH